VNLQRLLINRLEQRILVGVLAFLGIMVLVGWIAINEGGRMQVFERQYSARAIERGASLFNSTCSPCHGTDGFGSARAPALNSPYLFGHDYLAENTSERTALEAELNSEGLTDARREEINTRLAALDTERQGLITQMQAAIDKGYDPEAPSRLANLGWTSGLHNFIYTTLVHGRPTSSAYWPAAMPAWSQLAGGPLRSDQLEDLTTYILNWDKGDGWTVEDLLAINQFPIVPGAAGATAVENPIGVNTEIAAIMEGLAGVTGDLQRGQEYYTGTTYACFGCHGNAAVAPPMEGTWTRVEEVRLQDAQFAGYTGEQYLAESITHPHAYVVSPYPDGVMPDTFADRMDYQILADIIAYLKSQDQPLQ
jgi:mono/diheme cytochrome c family protein